MKVMQVFDCTDMPEDVHAAFYSRTEGTGNDCYVNWYTDECLDEDYVTYGDRGDLNIRLVDKWLHTQTPSLDKEVLINHWW